MSSGPSSGIKLDEVTIKWYEDNMRLLKVNQDKKYRYMIMTIHDWDGCPTVKKLVDYEQTTSQKEDFDHLLNAVPKDSPCYIILDLEAPSKDGDKSRKNQLYFITWCPDSLTTKKKMLCSSTKAGLAPRFKGAKFVNINDMSDFTYEEIIAT